MSVSRDHFSPLAGAPLPYLNEEASAVRLVDEAMTAPREPIVTLLQDDGVTPMDPPAAPEQPAPKDAHSPSLDLA